MDTISPQRLRLSLISHTNAGKTTLARTLLQRDIGEVRDAPHVTEFAESHLLVRSDAGDELMLWDTPGFGDSVRLLQRVQREGTALGWFLSAVWDRWRDRPFWASQQALRHVRDETDVVLYLVNAAEPPEAAPHVDAEMRLLAWMQRPVLVLLNQLGTDHDAARDAADIDRWRQHLRGHEAVRALLPLDAFARCWVQEGALWRTVAEHLQGAQREAMQRLAQAWWLPRQRAFDASVQVIANALAELALLREPLEGHNVLTQALGGLKTAMRQRWQSAQTAAATTPSRAGTAADAAQARLMQAVRERVATELAALLPLHALQGQTHAQAAIQLRVDQLLDVHARLDEKQTAAWGGVITGALAGLKADVASGGLTLGGGMLAGGLLGALAGMGVAKGLNVVRGGGPPWAGLSNHALNALTEAALLRYLAVAHFGRGRGDWQQDPVPEAWLVHVQASLEAYRSGFDAIWSGRDARAATDDTGAHADTSTAAHGRAGQLAEALAPLLALTLRNALARLYPEAAAQWAP